MKKYLCIESIIQEVGRRKVNINKGEIWEVVSIDKDFITLATEEKIIYISNFVLKHCFEEVEEDIIQLAIEKFGVNNQLDQAQEELSELIQAISKYKRGFKDGRKRVIEEIVDTEIMIMQIKIMLKLEQQELEEQKLYKLERLKNTIKRMKENKK